MEKRFVLMERRKKDAGLAATYRLIALVEGERVKEYRVSVKLGKEEREVPIENLGGAVQLFSMAAEGFVTPTTLDDILADARELGKI